MTALMYWTGLIVWCLWLGGIAGVLTLWCAGKWMARGGETRFSAPTGAAGGDRFPSARSGQLPGDSAIAATPAPSPLYVIPGYVVHIEAASDAEAVDALVGKETYA